MKLYEVCEELIDKLDKRKDKTLGKDKLAGVLLYALNGTGKTQMSKYIYDLKNVDDNDTVLMYSAFTQDLFDWDNENNVLYMKDNMIKEIIKSEGLDAEINSCFKWFINKKIESTFYSTTGAIVFGVINKEGEWENNIKISKGEENIFIWTVFYVILKNSLDSLSEVKEDRSTTIYDNIEYIIIDDPISSIDDYNIVKVAVSVYELLNTYSDKNNLGYLITTHHALFYNVLSNSFGSDMRNCKFELKKDNVNEFSLSSNEIFSYHIQIKNVLQEAINSNDLQKYHYNIFRVLLEKTSVFYGYNKFSDCLDDENKEHVSRLLNLYSHGKSIDMEYNELVEEEKRLLIETFESFCRKFNFGG